MFEKLIKTTQYLLLLKEKKFTENYFKRWLNKKEVKKFLKKENYRFMHRNFLILFDQKVALKVFVIINFLQELQRCLHCHKFAHTHINLAVSIKSFYKRFLKKLHLYKMLKSHLFGFQEISCLLLKESDVCNVPIFLFLLAIPLSLPADYSTNNELAFKQEHYWHIRFQRAKFQLKYSCTQTL